MEEKQAERVSILLMNPQNGEIYACVNVPEFDLNDPFTLTDDLNMQLNESGIQYRRKITMNKVNWQCRQHQEKQIQKESRNY